MKERIVAATNNQGKLKEIREILKEYEILSLKDLNCEIEVEEDQDTFEGNSLKKATEISKLLNLPCIADDSGLCIEELNGFPGVLTARFLGENASQEERNDDLIKRLEGKENRKATAITVMTYVDEKKGKRKENRKATAITVMTYVDEQKGKKVVARGETQGYIAKEKRGENGFGFDEIFLLENGKTLAELDSEEKNQISSRKRALETLKAQL